MRKIKAKGSKVKAKVLPIEVNIDEYVELLKATKYMHHKIAFMLGFESGLRISRKTLNEAFDLINIRIKKDTKLIDKFLMEMFDEYSKLKLNDANQKQ